jgi:hypothetical protein
MSTDVFDVSGRVVGAAGLHLLVMVSRYVERCWAWCLTDTRRLGALSPHHAARHEAVPG